MKYWFISFSCFFVAARSASVNVARFCRFFFLPAMKRAGSSQWHVLGAKRQKLKDIAKPLVKRPRHPLLISVGNCLSKIMNRLLELDGFPTLNLYASDQLALALMVADFVAAGWTFQCAIVMFLAGHTVRSPEILRFFVSNLSTKIYDRPLAILQPLLALLSQGPCAVQRTGLPFWIGNCTFHKGVPVLKKWLSSEHEPKLLYVVHLLHTAATASVNVPVLIPVVESLPHLKAYGYHVVRSFMNVCYALRSWGLTEISSCKVGTSSSSQCMPMF